MHGSAHALATPSTITSVTTAPQRMPGLPIPQHLPSHRAMQCRGSMHTSPCKHGASVRLLGMGRRPSSSACSIPLAPMTSPAQHAWRQHHAAQASDLGKTSTQLRLTPISHHARDVRTAAASGIDTLETFTSEASGRDPSVSGNATSTGPASSTSALTYLERLHIKDFALVTEQTVIFAPGVNVITGESGSGKSVLVEALSQVLGATAPTECVRAPADLATIEASFVVSPTVCARAHDLLEELGLPAKALPPSGQEALTAAREGRATHVNIRREIVKASNGSLRSRVYINGAASSLRVLRELSAALVDTNGQHSSMALRDSHTQLELLDRIAGTSGLAWRLRGVCDELADLEDQMAELDELGDEKERTRLQALCDSVRKARVQAGEEDELRRELKRLEARRGAAEQCTLVRLAISGEAGAGGVVDALRTIEAQLHTILMQEEQAAALESEEEEEHEEERTSESPEPEDIAGYEAGSPAHSASSEGFDTSNGSGHGGGGELTGASAVEAVLDQVAQAKLILTGAEQMVRSYARQYPWSPAEYEDASQRLTRIEKLMRAQGVRSSVDLLSAAEEAEERLSHYYEMEGKADEWYAMHAELEGQAKCMALELAARRRDAAGLLACAVETGLRDLAMAGSRFAVKVSWKEAKGSHVRGVHVSPEEAAPLGELGGYEYALSVEDGAGLDCVEFMLAAGPAEPLRPLAAIASGGEAARVMLALKAAPAQAAASAAIASTDTNATTTKMSMMSLLSSVSASAASSTAGSDAEGEASTWEAAAASSTAVPIMVLDELDSGIGARLGSAVGSILRRMSLPPHGASSQVIAVTHLPQVACYAGYHIKVGKHTGGDGRVTTHFHRLVEFGDRAQEVAAMLGLGYDVACDMLDKAQDGLPGGVRKQLTIAAPEAVAAAAGVSAALSIAAAAETTPATAPLSAAEAVPNDANDQPADEASQALAAAAVLDPRAQQAAAAVAERLEGPGSAGDALASTASSDATVAMHRFSSHSKAMSQEITSALMQATEDMLHSADMPHSTDESSSSDGISSIKASTTAAPHAAAPRGATLLPMYEALVQPAGDQIVTGSVSAETDVPERHLSRESLMADTAAGEGYGTSMRQDSVSAALPSGSGPFGLDAAASADSMEGLEATDERCNGSQAKSAMQVGVKAPAEDDESGDVSLTGMSGEHLPLNSAFRLAEGTTSGIVPAPMLMRKGSSTGSSNEYSMASNSGTPSTYVAYGSAVVPVQELQQLTEFAYTGAVQAPGALRAGIYQPGVAGSSAHYSSRSSSAAADDSASHPGPSQGRYQSVTQSQSQSQSVPSAQASLPRVHTWQQGMVPSCATAAAAFSGNARDGGSGSVSISGAVEDTRNEIYHHSSHTGSAGTSVMEQPSLGATPTKSSGTGMHLDQRLREPQQGMPVYTGVTSGGSSSSSAVSVSVSVSVPSSLGAASLPLSLSGSAGIAPQAQDTSSLPSLAGEEVEARLQELEAQASSAARAQRSAAAAAVAAANAAADAGTSTAVGASPVLGQHEHHMHRPMQHAGMPADEAQEQDAVPVGYSSTAGDVSTGMVHASSSLAAQMSPGVLGGSGLGTNTPGKYEDEGPSLDSSLGLVHAVAATSTRPSNSRMGAASSVARGSGGPLPPHTLVRVPEGNSQLGYIVTQLLSQGRDTFVRNALTTFGVTLEQALRHTLSASPSPTSSSTSMEPTSGEL